MYICLINKLLLVIKPVKKLNGFIVKFQSYLFKANWCTQGGFDKFWIETYTYFESTYSGL